MTDKKLRVLVIEDEAIAKIISRKLFTNAGCQVDVAETGAQAIEKLTNDFDLVMLDLGLPDYNGFDIADFIRKNLGDIATVPIVAISAHADCSYIEPAKKVGINGLFSKPLTSELCEDLLAGVSAGETDFWLLGQ